MHMKSHFFSLFTIASIIVGLSLGSSALAAAPIQVKYKGAAITTAVPGKPFNMNFEVKNTTGEVYNGVKVIFHLPEGVSHSMVSPDDSQIDSDTVTWSNVPMESDQSFYPSFTFTVDSGTPLKTKKTIWVQVLGSGMDETSKNFSITTVAKAPAKTTSLLTSADVTNLFKSVYGRTPTARELKYWVSRRSDKPGRTALLGAIVFHKANKISH